MGGSPEGGARGEGARGGGARGEGARGGWVGEGERRRLRRKTLRVNEP